MCLETSQKASNSILERQKQSRRLRWAGHVARMEEGRSAFKILTGKPIGKRPLGRSRWDDNIRIFILKTVVNTRNWID